MHVDGKHVDIGVVMYDAVIGAGTVTALFPDSFEVTFSVSTKRIYFDGGLLAGRKVLAASPPFLVFPTPEQEPLLIKMLAAIDVEHNHQ